MKTNTKIISVGLCWFALTFSPTAHAAPYFHPADIDNSEIGNRIPLILIHGIQSDPSIWNDFLNYWNSSPDLRADFKPYVFGYYTDITHVGDGHPDNPSDIFGLGTALGNYLQQYYSSSTQAPTYGFNGKPVVILAHSMGGLVARSMMAAYHFPDTPHGGDKVSLLITLATPHHGTPAANDYYVTPDPIQHWVNTHWFNLNPNFARDMGWDCSVDGRQFGWFCGAFIPSDLDYSKIIAYGARATTVSTGYTYPFDFLNLAGYANDGIVPIESSLFNGSAIKATHQVDGSCDHSAIYTGTKTVSGGTPIFDSIAADLEGMVPITPLPPAIFDVTPSTLTGLPSPQTQRLHIIGAGFTSSSTLVFTFGTSVFNSVPARLTFVSPNELDYDIIVDSGVGTWTVKAVKSGQESNVRTFSVVAQPPPETGSLAVTLQPVGAVSVGAQWQVDGGTYHNSGDVVTSLSSGSHTVSSKTISGYTTPVNKSISITGGLVTSDTETYTLTPSSTYTLALNSSGSGYIAPSFFGSGSGNIYNAGSTVQLTANANYGYHFVGWGGDLSGTVNPANIVMNGNKSVTANFATGDDRLGTVIVTIQPPEAVAAGVKWGWNDSDYRDSGTGYTTFPGGYYIVIHLTNGWWGAGLVPVTVTAGQTTNYTVAVSSTTGGTIGTDPSTYYTLAGAVTNFGSIDGNAGVARFYRPWSTTVDAAGNIFVADSWNETIRKITPSGDVSTLAGLALNTGSADGNGSDARFNQPIGVAVDSTGNVYVADMYNHTIRKISPLGAVSTLAGLAGSAGSTDDTGNGARFDMPAGVAVDTNGNVYVADANNETIRKITPAGVVTTLAGLAHNYGTADGTGSAARFHWPSAVAVDTSGNVYVADTYGFTIRKVTSAGAVTTLAGFPGSGGAADGTNNAARFSNPQGIAVDSAGNIYVADTGNNTIRKVTPTGVVSTLAGLSGSTGSSDGSGSTVRFNSPSGVALDSAGNVFVADAMNFTIRTTRPPLPKIFLSQIGNQATFSWPTSAVGFILESSTSLTGTNWSPVFPIPASAGAMNFVTNIMSGNARFYRLRK